MEGSLSASSGHAQQDDSWTCQRCGWVYPNAHPSAKHRRNHKKHCGKIKGFQLQSEAHKGGSSDEVSSDDGSHVNKESLPLQAAQSQHDRIKPVESANVLQSRQLPLPETNVSSVKQSETPVLDGISAPIDPKPEFPACKSTSDGDLTDVIKPESYATANLPDFGPFDRTSKALGDEMDVNTKEFPGEPETASNLLEGNGNMGVPSLAEGVEVDVQDSPSLSKQTGGVFDKGSMLEVAAPELAGHMSFSDEPSKDIKEEGRGNVLPRMDELQKAPQESQVLHSDHLREIQKKEISTTPTEQSIRRQGSSQEDDSWTCRRCGWVYPNLHPSAKHRRNHKKHCGNLKGFEVQTESHRGGSSDEVSSDEETKELIRHDLQQDTSIITPAQNQASGSITDTAILAEDPARDLLTTKGDSSAGGLRDTPGLTSVTVSVESSHVDPAISPAEENFHSEGEKGAAALGNLTLAPCGSDRLVIPQTKDENSSNEANGPEMHLKAVPFLVSSENLSNPVNDTSDDFVSTSKVSGTPRKISADSTSNVENSSVPPSDSSQPADVGSSKDEMGVVVTPISHLKAEGDEMCAAVTPISHPNVSGSANERKDVFGGTGFQQAVYIEEKRDDAAEPDLVKLYSSAGELLNSKFSVDNPPVLAAGSALNGDAENLPAVEGSSVKNVSPVAAMMPPDVTGSPNDIESEKKLVCVQTGPNAAEGSALKEDVLPIVFLPVAEVTSTNDLEKEEKFESVQAPLIPIELQSKDEISSEIAGGPNNSFFSCIDKVVETPQVIPVQFSDDQATFAESSPLEKSSNADSAKDSVLEKRNTSADSASVSDTPSSISLPLEPKGIPEGAPAKSAEDALATSTKVGVLGQTAGSFNSPGISESVAVLVEKAIADTTEESLTDEKPPSTSILPKSEGFPERGPSVFLGDTLSTNTNTVNGSGPSSLPEESEQLSLMKDGHKDETADVGQFPEPLEKPGIKDNIVSDTDFGSSGRSLDGTNSFTKAESDFSQRSDFASSSHLLSDSLEIYEDAPDTLEACSVGGSVESESLDEPRQMADGVQEDSKPTRVIPSDERVTGVTNELGKKLNDTNELEHMPIVMNGSSAGEQICEDTAATMPAETSYAVRSNMEKLKAPSPEAWQEPGPSTSKKEGKKMINSEVMEDGKSSEPHTALRSLMAKEGKDKMDQATASPSDTVDAKNSGDKEASANGKKSKSRLRSFWSQCVCCPAVH